MPQDLLTGETIAESKGGTDLLAYQRDFTDGASDNDPAEKSDVMFQNAANSTDMPGELALKYEQTKDKSNWLGTVDVLQKSIARLPDEIAQKALTFYSGSSAASVVNKDWISTAIKASRERGDKFSRMTFNQYGDQQVAPFVPIKITDVAAIPQSLAFSVISMGTGLAVGAGTAAIPIPGSPAAAWITGTLASGKAAYEMSKYQIMMAYLEAKNEEEPLTPETERQAKQYFEAAAHQYALWDAVPEALSNFAFGKILTKPLIKMVGKTIAGKIVQKISGLYGEEMITEATTQWGQARIEEEYGMRKPGEGQISPWQALKEVAPQTFLLTTIMGGAGAGTVAIANKVRASFNKETKGKEVEPVKLAQAENELDGRVNEVIKAQEDMKSQQETMAKDSMAGLTGSFDENGNYQSANVEGQEAGVGEFKVTPEEEAELAEKGKKEGNLKNNILNKAKQFNTAEEYIKSFNIKEQVNERVRTRPDRFEVGIPGIGGIEIEDDFRRAIVFRDEQGNPKGFVRFGVDENGRIIKESEEGGLVEVYVEPEYRRKGIATKLFNKAIKEGYDLTSVETSFTSEGKPFFEKYLTDIYNKAKGDIQRKNKIAKLEEKLATITDKQERAAVASESLSMIDEIRNFIKRSISTTQRSPDQAMQTKNIPSIYKSKKGLPVDVVMEQAKEQFGLNLESIDDFVEYLNKTERQREKYKTIIEEGKAETISKKEPTVIKQRIKDIKEGMREGKKIGKAEVKSAKDILDRRRALIRGAQQQFGLSDKDLKSISNRDIRLMSNFEFKKFIDQIRSKSEILAERRQLENEINAQIQEKELRNVDNLRKASGFPSIKKMTLEQLAEFGEMLEPYKFGDTFLTQRQIETVDNTDLKGIRTRREAQERLAQEAGVPIEELSKIKVGALDRFKQDVVLQKKNPLYKLLIEGTHAAFIQSELAYRDFERKLELLTNKARASRKTGIGQMLVPTDNLVFDYLSAENKTEIEAKMTPEEKDLALYLQTEYAKALKYLVEHHTLKTGLENYITNLRRGFLEAFKESGIGSAIKELFDSWKQDEEVFNILDQATGQILPLEKFFQFAMKRSGKINPTKNVAKAASAYFQTFHKKIALDSTIPKMMIYVQASTPMKKTPRGLEYDSSLEKFVKEWINTKKGRKAQHWIKQGGPLDIAILTLKSFITLMDLGLNIPVQVSAPVGEAGAAYITLGKVKMAKGTARYLTPKGRAFVKKYEGFVGKSLWQQLIEPAKNVTDKFTTAVMGAFASSSTRMNKISLLGMVTDEEYKTGEVSPERLAQIKLEIGKMRVIAGGKSIGEATTIGGAATQYKTWAIPIISTISSDFTNLIKKLKSGEAKWTSEEVVRFRREAELLTAVLLVTSLFDKDDKSFVGQLLQKVKREAFTILGALDPTLWLATPRMFTWLTDLGKALKSIITLEKYKAKGRENELRGVNQLGRMMTPRAVKTFLPDENKNKSRGMK